jgi:maltooligosyltrehalose trehalohydrolase
VTWKATLGAVPDERGTRFSVWAPDARTVEVVLEGGAGTAARASLRPAGQGRFATLVPGVGVGERYRLSLDGGSPLPDPASRRQPEGVHGPSEVVDPRIFRWTDSGWRGVALEDLVLYELHVGTFTPEGTFAAATRRLAYLRELGVTGVELMPVADFPGERNWGYDGAALFAPARCYGTPDDLRGLVGVAHGMGLAVYLDVVYNHLGPDGAYAAAFSRRFLSSAHRSEWGAGVNLDGPGSEGVRAFFIENALHWLEEYHLDGLRLDATHALTDRGTPHFLAELATRVHEEFPDRPAPLLAEDSRNLACMVRPAREGGWGLDAVWADDLHHELRRLLAGDDEGYYADFDGTMADVATTLRQGWFFTGQYSRYQGAPRGTDPTGIPPRRFVVCIQNHDQIGNRALGERLHHQVEFAAFRAASTLLLCAPQTPLLFMGQEWAASTPFRFFTDHSPDLGRLVTAGRREEFKRFSAFSSPDARARIPDPQSRSTYEDSRLRWEERRREPHASVLRLYRALLGLRRTRSALRDARAEGVEAAALDAGTLLLRREDQSGALFVLVVRLLGSGTVELPASALRGAAPGAWQPILGTEEPDYAPDPQAIDIELADGILCVRFPRPGAVALEPRGGAE